MSNTAGNFLESVKFYQANIKCCFQIIQRPSGEMSLNYDVCPHSQNDFSWNAKSTIQLSLADVSNLAAHTLGYLPEKEDFVVAGHGADNKTSLIVKRIKDKKGKQQTYFNFWHDGKQLCYFDLSKPQMFNVFNITMKILKSAHQTTQDEMLAQLKLFYGNN